MADENRYTKLIAGAMSHREKFQQWLYELTEPLAEAQRRLEALVGDFDIDLATGDQLDAVGVRVGLSRKLKIKITDVFFAFDDVDGVGFDLGIWQTPRDDTYGITELGDEVYRTALKAKVALNQYSGRNEDLRAILDEIAEAFGINSSQLAYTDLQDMAITLYIDKDRVPPIVWSLFYNGIFSVNHAGIGSTVVDGVSGALATSEGKILTTDDGDILLMDIK